jgi:hypothetical protein
LLPSLCYHRFAAIALLPSLCCHRFATIALLPSLCCHRFAAIALLPSLCCNHFAGTASVSSLFTEVAFTVSLSFLLSLILTFDIQFNIIWFTHAQLIFSCATVKASSVSCHRAEDDFLFWTENPIESLFPP